MELKNSIQFKSYRFLKLAILVGSLKKCEKCEKFEFEFDSLAILDILVNLNLSINQAKIAPATHCIKTKNLE